MELARDALALALLRLQHALRAQMSLVLQAVEHRIEHPGYPAHVRIGVARVDAGFMDVRLDRAHHRLQLP
jgi:hypothetical protein